MPEGKCYVKIRKPAQAFLEAEGECHMKIHKPAQAVLVAERQDFATEVVMTWQIMIWEQAQAGDRTSKTRRRLQR